jgi:hypothetical protein
MPRHSWPMSSAISLSPSVSTSPDPAAHEQALIAREPALARVEVRREDQAPAMHVGSAERLAPRSTSILRAERCRGR